MEVELLGILQWMERPRLSPAYRFTKVSREESISCEKFSEKTRSFFSVGTTENLLKKEFEL